MRVRELKWFGCSVVLAAVVGQWAQAENGRPSRQTMAAMGLGGMTILSDDEASSIRGMGFKGGGHGGGSSVAVFGNSFATINTPLGSAHSENGYAAEGKKSASGKNYSEAGAQISISNGGNKPGGNHGSPVGGKSSKGKMGGGGYGGGGMGGHPGGGMGGHGGGGATTITFKVFAGGFSSAHAH